MASKAPPLNPDELYFIPYDKTQHNSTEFIELTGKEIFAALKAVAAVKSGDIHFGKFDDFFIGSNETFDMLNGKADTAARNKALTDRFEQGAISGIELALERIVVGLRDTGPGPVEDLIAGLKTTIHNLHYQRSKNKSN